MLKLGILTLRRWPNISKINYSFTELIWTMIPWYSEKSWNSNFLILFLICLSINSLWRKYLFENYRLFSGGNIEQKDLKSRKNVAVSWKSFRKLQLNSKILKINIFESDKQNRAHESQTRVYFQFFKLSK